MENNYNINQDATLRDYAIVLFRHKAVLLVTFITVMLTVLLGLELKTPIYEATVKILILAEKNIASPFYQEIPGFKNMETSLTECEIVTSNPILERAAKALELDKRPLDYEKQFCTSLKKKFIDLKLALISLLKANEEKVSPMRKTIENIKENLSVNPVRDTKLLTIAVKDFSAEEAVKIANVISRSYIIFDLEQQLAELKMKYGEKHPIVLQLKANISSWLDRLGGAPMSAIDAMGPATVKIIEQAQIPIKPISSKKMVTLILALFMSIFLGVMLCFVFEYLNQTIKTPKEIEKILNLPCLGFIPKKKLKASLIIKDFEKKALYTSAYQTIGDQVDLLMKDKKLKTLLLGSTLPKEGVSTIVANLSAYLAGKSSLKVLLIDANLRKPIIHKLFKIDNKCGLDQILMGKNSPQDAIITVTPQLDIITAGTTSLNPITLLQSTAMTEFMKLTKEKYDCIIIDSANLKQYKDIATILIHVDAGILVINEGKLKYQVADYFIPQLGNNKSKLIGAILNNRTFPIPKFLYKIL